jgi:hypothetical protein
MLNNCNGRNKSRYLYGKSLMRRAGRPRRHFVSDVALPSNFIRTNPLISVRTSATHPYMKTARWELRIEPEELTEWKAMAAERGMLLSEWIRSCCNGAGPSTARRIEEIEGSARISDVRQDAAVPAAKGRESVAVPSPGICANCEHRRSKHGGFGSACQEDNCLCSGFE